MRLKREPGVLHFNFNLMESRLLVEVLRQIAEHYRLPPHEIPPEVAAVWYSTRGCASAKMSDQETREWLEQLHQLKAAGRERLESWGRQLAESGSLGGARLAIPTDDAPGFMRAINDYRLMTAARHGIGEREMDIHSPLELLRLPAKRQAALIEIHFLALILEQTLRALQDT